MQDKNQNPQEVSQQNEIRLETRPKVTGGMVIVRKKGVFGNVICETTVTVYFDAGTSNFEQPLHITMNSSTHEMSNLQVISIPASESHTGKIIQIYHSESDLFGASSERLECHIRYPSTPNDYEVAYFTVRTIQV